MNKYVEAIIKSEDFQAYVSTFFINMVDDKGFWSKITREVGKSGNETDKNFHNFVISMRSTEIESWEHRKELASLSRELFLDALCNK